MKVETIKIKHPDGYSLINKADFDESIHELFEESNQPVSALPARAVEVSSTDVSFSVEKTEDFKINLNTADKKTLISLPGIGAKTAEEIIDARPFESLRSAIAQFKVLEELPVEV